MRSWVIAALVAVTCAGSAKADPLFGVTDLGTDYHLQTNSDGHITGVTNGDGADTYVLDKVPVTPLAQPIRDYNTLEPHPYKYFVQTLTNGTTNAGYFYDVFSSGTMPTALNTYGYMWFTAPPRSPIEDFNTHGVVVGISDALGAAWTPDGVTSEFLAKIDKWHSPYAWDLNNAIAPIPGVDLTKAFLVDDEDRILADGSDSHVYLLTPTNLGAPAPVPEPGTLTAWGLVALAAGIGLRRRTA